MAKKKAKKLIKKAGPTISKKEMNKIVKAAGSTEKALNKISSVQQAAKQSDKPAPSINAGAANMLIRQAQSTPAGVYQLGSSKIAQAIRGMAGTPAGQRNPQSGYPTYAAQPGSGLMIGGTVLKPGGGIAVKNPAAPKVTPEVKTRIISDSGGFPGGRKVDAANPNQELLDKISTLETGLSEQSTYFQDLMNQSQMAAQQQMAEMSNMFNQQMIDAQGMYDMQIQQANAQALADQEAARAFMINQGRGVMPANLQIGATYGTPQLAGTQGFKRQDRRPTLTPAQTATAFTAPTLAATAAANPMMTTQPTVLNV
jgi:hypothetical protein